MSNLANTNLFKHAPKELVTDAFITWLFYFLDCDEYYMQKKIVFDELLLKPEDIGKEVNKIKIIKQQTSNFGRTDIILEFNLNGKEEKILFENKTWTTTNERQLNDYKKANPEFYKYIYLKLAYVDYEELKLTKRCGYEVIDVFKLSQTFSKIKNINLILMQYLEYIDFTFKDHISQFPLKLLNENNTALLWDGQAQHFLVDEIYKQIDGKVSGLCLRYGSSFGRPWTQLDIYETDNIYGKTEEKIFWRVDIRGGEFYLRLNQYAYIDISHKELKLKRLEKLREIANNISNKLLLVGGRLSNKGLMESEIIIFFLNQNRIKSLLDLIPTFTLEFIVEYEKILIPIESPK
ncbi:MAG: hypothetical protein FD181_2185 [Prolixibacteraceae bacterium]|nr:MAG: hypothetical protein FD181_2185 [Prolixibacteraceae bacterium]